MHGYFTNYYTERGYGFIKCEETNETLFCHYSEIVNAGATRPAKDMNVFISGIGEPIKKKGFRLALGVTLL